MKYKLYLSLILYGLYSCNPTAGPKTSTQIPTNYVVFIDLKNAGNSSKSPDMSSSELSSALDRFEEDVRTSLLIKSMDKFVIKVSSQNGYENSNQLKQDELCLDLSQYSAAEKISKLKQFRDELPERIKILYQKTQLKNQSTSHKKAQSTAFYKEVENKDRNNETGTKAIILTDVIASSK